jgi:endonuclease/exonuclease/phosphatase family metal-dependent hydrolase
MIEEEAQRLRRALILHKRLVWGLTALLVSSLLGHLWIANQRVPVAAALGQGVEGQTQAADPSRKQIRVATYNIRRGKGTDRVRDIGRAAGVLRSADIAALNEVAGPSLMGGADQARQIGERLDAGWLYAPNQRRWYRYHFGNALISRFDIGRWNRAQIAYDRERSHSRRNLLTATVELWNRSVRLLITHLDRGTIRGDQLAYVLEELRRYPVAILLGDLNSTRDDPLLRELLADPAYTDAIAATLGSADVAGRVDWIIVRGLRVVGGGFERAGISDHPAYWVDLAAP